jgi:hypothetical protein
VNPPHTTWIRVLACSLLIATAPLRSIHGQTQEPPRRQPVTPELLRSAFADSLARTTLQRARVARLAQDSALHAYDAKSYLRFSIGMGVRKIGTERLLLRTEQSARVKWAGGSAVSIEPTGRRTGFPMGKARIDLTDATPIPYFPGRESLWIPSGKMGVVQPDVDEDSFLHPLATGAEAYYRYASGDTMSIGLPGGRRISLRELRITARHPDWRAFVGSFWFDAEGGSLVRAAYRMSTKIDLWQTMSDGQRRTIDKLETRARTDTGLAARRARQAADDARGTPLERLGVTLLEGTLTPATVNLAAVTVEYGLFDGRFWLPRLNVANGEIAAGFLRLPLTWQEKFDYESINGPGVVVPTPAQVGLLPADSVWVSSAALTLASGDAAANGVKTDAAHLDSATSRATRSALEDSLAKRYRGIADSLAGAAARARTTGDTAQARALAKSAVEYSSQARQLQRRRDGCATDSAYYAGGATRFGGAVRAIVRMPCDVTRLSSSPDLPGSIYGDGEEIFGAADRDALLASLDYSLQPGWGPQWPEFRTGLAYLRYNRIEALSVGGSVTSALGLGYTAQATARIGTGDRVPNADVSLSRSNGRDSVRVGLYYRLGVANDDWGAPLSLGASISNLVSAHDEGFYYRTWGAELAGTRDAPGFLSGAALTWRGFAERQRTAGVAPKTQASLANLFGDSRFERNIDAASVSVLGAGAELSRTFGVDPAASQLLARLRGEGAFTRGVDSVRNSGYARLVLDGTVTHSIGSLAVALTGATGASAGDLPVQRQFFIGGLQTVRGQAPSADGVGHMGNSFWLTRAEVGPQWPAFRPTVFYDIGWAGPRADFVRSAHPLSGAGVGIAILGGLLKLDAARGIGPGRSWRFDMSLGARF